MSKGFIRQWYEKRGPQWCAERTGLSYGSVKQLAHSMGLRWDKARRGRIESHLRNYLKEDGWHKVAADLGIAEGTARRWAKKFDIEGPPDGRGAKRTKLSEEQVGLIVGNYPERSCVEIGDILGLSRDIVERVLRDAGLYLGFGRRADRCTNKAFFSEWSENLAYVLGYMCADGSVGEYTHIDTDGRRARKVCQSSITSKDRQILEDIRTAMGLMARVCSYEKDGETYHHLTTGCRWVYEQWRKLGIQPRKTYEGLPEPLLSEDFLPAFVRGFFDGDGCWSKGAISFCCMDASFLQWLLERLLAVAGGDIPRIAQCRDNTLCLKWSIGGARAARIREWMKPTGKGLRLKRKWAA